MYVLLLNSFVVCPSNNMVDKRAQRKGREICQLCHITSSTDPKLRSPANIIYNERDADTGTLLIF